MIYFVVSSLLSVKFITTCVSHYVRKSKTVLDSGFHAVDSRFQTINFGFLVSGTWIPDFNRYRDSGFLELNSGFPSAGFPILQEQIRRLNLDSTSKISHIPEFGLPYMD